MASKNSLKEPQKLTPSEVTRMFSGMTPLQRTRYYNKCMTNPYTPPANVNLLMQYRAQNADLFLSEDQMPGSRKSKGSWVAERGFSGGWRNRSNGRVYTSSGYSYDNNGRYYDPSGNEAGGWHDGGPDPEEYGFVYGDDFVKGKRSAPFQGSGRTRRQRKPIDQPRSSLELVETLKGLNNPVRGRRYLDSIIQNESSNPETVANAKKLIAGGTPLVATDEQMAGWTPKARSGSGRRIFSRRPVDEPRSAEDIAGLMGRLRSNVARTRYFDKVVGNPDSNPQTVDNLMAYRNANQHMFASDEEAQAAPRGTGRRASFWKSKEEFDGMSPRKKYFFVGAVNRNSRSKNTAYGLRVITDPETTPDDREAMTQVVRENPLLFFRRAKSGKGRGQ
ncbi:MAG: hypothetical protein J5674_05690 [Candidatus Methanomethylophilaceae archaeon]|nr:hypothetical protein [Candidatus Methanomethylophilaceae archaeon]